MSTIILHGDDEVLLAAAVSDKVRELIGDGDRSLMLDNFSGEYLMGAVVDAASTPPFFTERRVEIGRAHV